MTASIKPTYLTDLHGAARAACDATVGVTELVEAVHSTVLQLPFPLGRAPNTRLGGIPGLVYRGIQGGARLLAQGLDSAYPSPAENLADDRSAPLRDVFVAVLNGVYGDYLARADNPLAIEMSLRHRGRRLDAAKPMRALGAAPAASEKIVVLLHGLCMSDRQWTMRGHDYGAALAEDLGYTPLYLRYNSGLRVVENGRALAELLEVLVQSWPRRVKELAIIGFSMGGLVARSACHRAGKLGHAWLSRLGKLLFLGTPHHGAPLERGGQLLQLMMETSPYSAPFARLGETRSAGITDMRHGSVTEHPAETVPLPDGVSCYAAAAALCNGPGLLSRGIGDGVVPLDSALGRHSEPARALAIPEAQRWVGYRMGHVSLLGHPAVYRQLRDWL